MALVRLLALLGLFVGACEFAQGQPRRVQWCRNQELITKEFNEIALAVEHIARLIEAVPPSEADYIREEKRIALEQKNAPRFAIVEANRFYYPLAFHDGYKVFRENLEAAKTASGKEQARYLVEVLSQFADLTTRMGDYIAFDKRRPQPVLTADSRQSMYIMLPLSHGSTVQLLQCVISVL